MMDIPNEQPIMSLNYVQVKWHELVLRVSKVTIRKKLEHCLPERERS